ncbi:hypothetical protein Mgra_00006287 [Meloidogyne graminicola]|uniref:Uncharacterized protein n=1 Tax=Meloidogyne graminicola TaxID=189291 RepID=A0A8S9ZLY9_9BILA|nr:hypothetical protein Mgra_00006287 [Meloidogyne graminicola]
MNLHFLYLHQLIFMVMEH